MISVRRERFVCGCPCAEYRLSRAFIPSGRKVLSDYDIERAVFAEECGGKRFNRVIAYGIGVRGRSRYGITCDEVRDSIADFYRSDSGT